jgi:hypothetical protein
MLVRCVSGRLVQLLIVWDIDLIPAARRGCSFLFWVDPLPCREVFRVFVRDGLHLNLNVSKVK